MNIQAPFPCLPLSHPNPLAPSPITQDQQSWVFRGNPAQQQDDADQPTDVNSLLCQAATSEAKLPKSPGFKELHFP